MMPLYREDPYAREARGVVQDHTPEGGVIVDPPLFYPTGGGQPGDSGRLEWDRRTLPIATAVRAEDGGSVLVPSEPAAMPPRGAHVVQLLDWERRHLHMRLHTALHLLTAVIPLPVTGGQVGAGAGYLDFDMPEMPADTGALERALNALVDRDLPVSEDWIDHRALDADPALFRTLSVRPPRARGPVRLIRIGQGAGQVDLQPCGGTHVARTGEVGALVISNIEDTDTQTRRVSIALDL